MASPAMRHRATSPQESLGSTADSHVSTEAAAACSSLSDYVTSCARAWETKHHARAVAPLQGISPPGDDVQVLTQVAPSATDGDPIETDASVFPWILLDKMPPTEYYRYAHFFIQVTYAAMNTEHPDRKAYFASGAAGLTLIPVVGARLGMLSSLGFPAKAAVSTLSSCFHYDVRRRKLYIKAASAADTPSMSLFRNELRHAALPPEYAVEIALSWCHVAPTILAYVAPLHSIGKLGGQGQYAQRAVQEYFNATMSTEANSRAYPGSNLPWDSAESAVVSGYSRDLVHRWASDPILDVTAARRILLSIDDISKNRAREAQLRKALARPRSDVGRLPPTVARSSVRAFRMSHVFDDTASLATALMVDADAGEEDELAPGDSITSIGEPLPLTADEVEAIRTAGRNVVHGAPTHAFADPEPSLHW